MNTSIRPQIKKKKEREKRSWAVELMSSACCTGQAYTAEKAVKLEGSECKGRKVILCTSYAHLFLGTCY